MKIRQGFVSNSSSSSFVLNKSDLKPFQLCAIKYHLEFGRLFGFDCTDDHNRWRIRELLNPSSDKIYLSTSMNNFDMREFLIKIGVSKNKIPEEDEWN